ALRDAAAVTERDSKRGRRQSAAVNQNETDVTRASADVVAMSDDLIAAEHEVEEERERAEGVKAQAALAREKMKTLTAQLQSERERCGKELRESERELQRLERERDRAKARARESETDAKEGEQKALEATLLAENKARMHADLVQRSHGAAASLNEKRTQEDTLLRERCKPATASRDDLGALRDLEAQYAARAMEVEREMAQAEVSLSDTMRTEAAAWDRERQDMQRRIAEALASTRQTQGGAGHPF
ncbi:hypothetical protein KIPB_003153, partial [Kipferlia bialata]